MYGRAYMCTGICLGRLRNSRDPWSGYPLYLLWYKSGNYEYETKLPAIASTLRLDMPIGFTYVSLLHVRHYFNSHFTSKIRG